MKRHEARNEQALADLEARISEIEKRDAEVRSAEVKIEKRETAVDELKFEVSEDKIEVEAQKKEWGKVRVCEEQSKGPRRRVYWTTTYGIAAANFCAVSNVTNNPSIATR